MRRMRSPGFWTGILACASVWMELCVAVLSDGPYSHAGICPNDMNPNLWVDAMSTCTRECESDQECETFEKCCQNVCGSRSCVAARFLDGVRGPGGPPPGASCAGFLCVQQGSECEVWEGAPVCKCRDRCEREPRFTCASDGLTYYNRCYMDAEACSKGTTLTVVTCRFHLTWPHTSPPLAPVTTLRPTTAPLRATAAPPTQPQPPAVIRTPVRQAVAVGGTASFPCQVSGRPPPQVTWEKRAPDGAGGPPMRPNHVLGNMVVTNIGQLVIYNARLQDSGVYTCTARNPSGWVQSHHPLTVLPPPLPAPGAANRSRCGPEACARPPDGPPDDPPDGPRACGGRPETVSWYYEPKANSCFPLGRCPGDGPAGGLLDSYDQCMRCCGPELTGPEPTSPELTGPELTGPCSLPSSQGPCKAYEPRWAYSSVLGGCRSFVYGGCDGNQNNFESKEACEEACPLPRSPHCRACRPRGRMVTSFCRSDFVIVGRMAGLTQDGDSGHALVTVEEILRDEKMGLRFFGKEPLEVTFVHMDWNCPCPNITAAAAEGQVIVMGNVSEGMAVLHPESYVGASSPRRVRKLKEVISKNTCDILKAITSGPQ
ncbi:WAP, Kazal, immunoglobulin, Kunitz and NTR domain-containing protein 2 [Menidia menidia]